VLDDEEYVATVLYTLKFSNFRMLIGKIIKQRFSHNFKILLKIYFLYRKFRIRKSIDCFYKLNKINVCECCLCFRFFCFCLVCVEKEKKKTKNILFPGPKHPLGPTWISPAQPSFPAQLHPQPTSLPLPLSLSPTGGTPLSDPPTTSNPPAPHLAGRTAAPRRPSLSRAASSSTGAHSRRRRALTPRRLGLSPPAAQSPTTIHGGRR
jgi:hypothetical protein